MNRRNILIGTGVAAALGIAALGFGPSLEAQPYGGGWGMMGGYGPGGMHGYGRGGYGPGRMHGYARGQSDDDGPGWNCPWYRGDTAGPGQSSKTELNLSTADVKKELERWLTVQGNPRLKVGEIREKANDTIEADIVTKDNSLVQQFTVNRKTGFYRPTQEAER